MKLFRMLGRNIRDAFKSVFRNFSLSIASISCITITLIVVSVAVILSYNINSFTRDIKQDVTVVVFLESDTSEDNRNLLENKLKDIENVVNDSVIFVSKNNTLGDMQNKNDVFQHWTEEDNPLLDSFTLKVKDVEEIRATAEQIQLMDYVSNVDYGAKIIDQLLGVFKIVEKVTVVAVIALIFVTAFLISNTIKLTIFSRRKEIEIMRLVGASNISIRMPFMVEGLFLGVLGSLVPIILSIYSYTILYTNFNGVLFTNLIRFVNPAPFIYLVSLGLLGIAMLVGMFGSARAVRKYLKI